MKTFKIVTFALVLSMLCPLISMAQRDVYNWQISPYAGLLTLSNDIAVPEDANSYAYGLRFERRLGNDFTMGLHLTQLNLYGAAQNNLTGGFLSLGYHWDNGYLFSQRSTVSIFHRLELGFVDQYDKVESISGNSGDFTLGFENGVKFRLGDRVSADFALELLGTKESITDGDITKNLRYNVWKIGVSYHLGSRKSNYVAPVFVPYDGIPIGSKMDKIDRKDDTIWIANDSIYNSQLKEERLPEDTSSARPQLSRADSLLIFMYFDSLYQRRALVDTTVSGADTLFLGSDSPTAIGDTALADADSVYIDEVEKSLHDSSFAATGDTLSPDTLRQQSAIKSTADTVNVGKPIAIEQEADSTAKTIETKTDSMRMDTVYIEKSGVIEQKADTSANAVQPTTVPVRVDTVYMEKPMDTEQKADTSAQTLQSQTPPSRVDTLYVVSDKPVGESSGETSEKADEEKADAKSKTSSRDGQAYQESLDEQNALLAQQNKLIQQNQKEIESLRQQNSNNKGDAGKVIAAGAAGAALGALVSGGDKKQKPDTVYYESAAAQQKLDSLELELAALKKQYGITDTIPAFTDTIPAFGDTAYTPDPPIGMYFKTDSTGTDSVWVALSDTTLKNTADSLRMPEDSIAIASQLKTDTLKKPATVNGVVIPVEGSDQAEMKTDSAIVEDKSITEPTTEPIAEEATPALTGNYPVSCNFGLNKTALDAAELKKLDPVITDLKNNESLNVLLTGYTDSSGNAAYNLQLSKNRAKSVMDYLTAQGVSADRIEVRGNGVLEAADRYSPDARRVDVSLGE